MIRMWLNLLFISLISVIILFNHMIMDYVVEINIKFLNEIESEKRQVMLLFGVVTYNLMWVYTTYFIKLLWIGKQFKLFAWIFIFLVEY